MTNLIVANYVKESNDIWSTRQILKDLDLAFYLLLFDRLEHFDDTFLVVDDIDSFKNLGIFPPPYRKVSLTGCLDINVNYLFCVQPRNSLERPTGYSHCHSPSSS
jgi:hypothetical protein